MPVIDVGTGIAIFGAAFGMWAWVVAWGVSVVRKEVIELKSQIINVNNTQVQHVNQTERRLTMLETEFQFFKNALLNKLSVSNGSSSD